MQNSTKLPCQMCGAKAAMHDCGICMKCGFSARPLPQLNIPMTEVMLNGRVRPLPEQVLIDMGLVIGQEITAEQDEEVLRLHIGLIVDELARA